MPRHYSIAANRADLAIDQFRRDMLRAKAPRTHELREQLCAILAEMSPRRDGARYAELDRLDEHLAYDAERGVEQTPEAVARITRILADVVVHLTDEEYGATGFCGVASGLLTLDEGRVTCPQCKGEEIA